MPYVDAAFQDQTGMDPIYYPWADFVSAKDRMFTSAAVAVGWGKRMRGLSQLNSVGGRWTGAPLGIKSLLGGAHPSSSAPGRTPMGMYGAMGYIGYTIGGTPGAILGAGAAYLTRGKGLLDLFLERDEVRKWVWGKDSVGRSARFFQRKGAESIFYNPSVLGKGYYQPFSLGSNPTISGAVGSMQAQIGKLPLIGGRTELYNAQAGLYGDALSAQKEIINSLSSTKATLTPKEVNEFATGLGAKLNAIPISFSRSEIKAMRRTHGSSTSFRHPFKGIEESTASFIGDIMDSGRNVRNAISDATAKPAYRYKKTRVQVPKQTTPMGISFGQDVPVSQQVRYNDAWNRAQAPKPMPNMNFPDNVPIHERIKYQEAWNKNQTHEWVEKRKRVKTKNFKADTTELKNMLGKDPMDLGFRKNMLGMKITDVSQLGALEKAISIYRGSPKSWLGRAGYLMNPFQRLRTRAAMLGGHRKFLSQVFGASTEDLISMTKNVKLSPGDLRITKGLKAAGVPLTKIQQQYLVAQESVVKQLRDAGVSRRTIREIQNEIWENNVSHLKSPEGKPAPRTKGGKLRAPKSVPRNISQTTLDKAASEMARLSAKRFNQAQFRSFAASTANGVFYASLALETVDLATKAAWNLSEKIRTTIDKIRTNEFGTGKYYETEVASTERSRALQAIQSNHMMASGYLGNEASNVRVN